MCIGIPMQVTTTEPGHAWVEGRGQRRRINTALVQAPAIGDWLLVYIDGAREALSAERALEVNAALDLIDAAMLGPQAGATLVDPWGDPGFALPSAMSAADVAALAGHAPLSIKEPR